MFGIGFIELIIIFIILAMVLGVPMVVVLVVVRSGSSRKNLPPSEFDRVQDEYRRADETDDSSSGSR